ncbi:CBS and ACT domain-containing protein [Desulfatitalea alkaliphila]|uniref:CBS and ACT domain-containing protein n=1 Tax=Desulfatitalea alkaliphila TaxID=2929485 RepID=A0AA41QZL3_9BACT|nr:CBS and ACT domain-containing protein [Desulfatitalea alkaliphila]MCJ8499249.1 CBS and ACT domain-containing protein [Desulfatitalea alkaliphila]
MFVSRSMTRKVVTVSPDISLSEVQERMKTHNIRHLPVVANDDRLVGIVTDRDIRSAMPLPLIKGQDDPESLQRFARLTVADVMTPDPMTISPAHTLQDALLLIQEKRVGAFPVVDQNGKLTGIISVRDLLRAFINVLGIGQPGTLLCILVEEKVGQMKRIVDAITEEGISCGSILVARYWEKDKRAVFPYLLTNNVIRIKQRLRDAGFTLLDPMQWYLDQLPKNE